MRVPKDDDIGLEFFQPLFVFCAELMKLAEDVTNPEPVALEVFESLFRKLTEGVVVAFDCQHWRDFTKLRNYVELSDVAGVDYQIDAPKHRTHFWIEKTVSV